MESANRVPIGLSGYDALDSPWVVPAPGLTGIAITSHRAYNIVKLISSAKLSIYAAASIGACPRSKTPPRAMTAHAIRAILLAMAPTALCLPRRSATWRAQHDSRS